MLFFAPACDPPIFVQVPDSLPVHPGPSSQGLVQPNSCNDVLVRWQPNAWRTAKWLFGLAVVLFTTAVVAGIVDDEDALWKSSLGVCCLLIVLAVVASVFACRHTNYGGSWRAGTEYSSEQETPADTAPCA